MSLLYIKASPRGPRSHATAVADRFVQSYREAHPREEVNVLDIFSAELPAFDGAALNAKYAILHGQEPIEQEKAAWQPVATIIEQFKAADKFVFAVPMWNFGIPYRLKQYLDIIVQPTYTFSYTSAEGYKGLVTGRPVFVAYARGGEYPGGSEFEAFDLQKRYLELILGFIGCTDIRSVPVEPTLMGGPEVAKQKRNEAITLAGKMAKEF